MVVETENDDREASRIVEADKWKCPGCGIKIVAGFASTRGYQPTIQVTDEKRRIK
jgi:hypothetical protein